MDLRLSHPLSNTQYTPFIERNSAKKNPSLLLIETLSRESLGLLSETQEGQDLTLHAMKLLGKQDGELFEQNLKLLPEKIFWNFIVNFTNDYSKKALDDNWTKFEETACKVIIWGLANKKIYKPDTKMDSLVWLFQRASVKKLEDYSSLVEVLNKQGLLPLLSFFLWDKNEEIIPIILGHTKESAKELVISHLHEDKDKALQEMFKFIYKSSFEQKSTNVENISLHLKRLKAFSIPCFKFFKNKLEEYQNEWERVSKIAKEGMKKPLLFADLSQSELKKVRTFALKTENEKCLATLTKIENKYSEKDVKKFLFFNLTMDKLFVPEILKFNLKKETAASTLAEALKSSVLYKPDKKLKYETKLFQKLAKRLEKPLNQYAIYAGSGDAFPNKMIKTIKEMYIGEQVILQAGCLGHAAHLLVTKTLNGFQLIIYNTGSGVLVNHAHWKGTSKYQTFKVIEHVPESSLLNKAAWEGFSLAREQHDMGDVYDLFEDLLGKGGVKLAPETDEEFYEHKQSSLTCAVQGFMAYLLHQAMAIVKEEIPESSPAEQKAFYRWVKTRLLSFLYIQNKQDLELKDLTSIQTILGKLQAEEMLIEVAKSKKAYEELIGQYASVIAVTTGDTFLQRYATLRKLAQSLLDTNEKILSFDVVGNWAKAKQEHGKTVKAGVEKIFNENILKREDTLFLIYRLLTTTDFPEVGIQKAIEILGISDNKFDEEGIKLLLGKLAPAPLKNEAFVKLIAQAFIDHKQKAAAKFVIKCWKELTSS